MVKLPVPRQRFCSEAVDFVVFGADEASVWLGSILYPWMKLKKNLEIAEI